MGYPHLAPVITPGLAKKVLGLHLAGTNMDDLSEGVSPFTMIIQDYTSPTSGRDYLEATRVAQDYDDLVGGSSMADLSDLKTINSSTKVQVPTSYPTARAMLQAYAIFLGAILGPDHDRVKSYQAFVNNYMAKETFYIGHLSSMDGVYGPARLLHYIQLLMRAWFYENKIAVDATARAAISAPNFRKALYSMHIGDMTWLPTLPPKYIVIPTEPKAPKAAMDTVKVEGDKKKAQQIHNPDINAEFDAFQTKISTAKFNDIIKKVGAPPTVKCNGTNVPMCISYHLRGQCFSNCSRKADHAKHTNEEDVKLMDWCKKAFE